MKDLIIIENNVPLADSRVVAEKLGIQHGPFITNIILKYQKEVENAFGPVHFQNGPKKSGYTGGDTPKYALLTETQANAYMSFAKNTRQAIDLKIKLVAAFDEAKKIISQLLNERQSPSQDNINEVHRRIRDFNMLLVEKLRFTVEEKANMLALSGMLKELGFAANAFLDSSLAKAFYPWCEEQGYDMSLVKETKRARIVGYELNEDRMTYNWDKPMKRHVNSYPQDPFGLAWEMFLVEYYWPGRFLPYITRKYRGEERAQNIEAGMKVISFFTGLNQAQITESCKKGRK